MPNEIDVKRLRELESKATPGPWKHDTDTDYIWGPQMQMVASDINGTAMRGVGEGLPIDINGELMCEARNNLPAILDRIEELEKDAKDLARETLASWHVKAAAETELSALKAKMEKVREWAESGMAYPMGTNVIMKRDIGTIVLALLDGKQQQSAAEQQFYTLGGVYVDREPPFACWKATDGIHYQTPEQANAAMILDGKEGSDGPHL